MLFNALQAKPQNVNLAIFPKNYSCTLLLCKTKDGAQAVPAQRKDHVFALHTQRQTSDPLDGRVPTDDLASLRMCRKFRPRDVTPSASTSQQQVCMHCHEVITRSTFATFYSKYNVATVSRPANTWSARVLEVLKYLRLKTFKYFLAVKLNVFCLLLLLLLL